MTWRMSRGNDTPHNSIWRLNRGIFSEAKAQQGFPGEGGR